MGTIKMGCYSDDVLLSFRWSIKGAQVEVLKFFKETEESKILSEENSSDSALNLDLPPMFDDYYDVNDVYGVCSRSNGICEEVCSHAVANSTRRDNGVMIESKSSKGLLESRLLLLPIVHSGQGASITDFGNISSRRRFVVKAFDIGGTQPRRTVRAIHYGRTRSPSLTLLAMEDVVEQELIKKELRNFDINSSVDFNRPPVFDGYGDDGVGDAVGKEPCRSYNAGQKFEVVVKPITHTINANKFLIHQFADLINFQVQTDAVTMKDSSCLPRLFDSGFETPSYSLEDGSEFNLISEPSRYKIDHIKFQEQADCYLVVFQAAKDAATLELSCSIYLFIVENRNKL